MGGRKKTDARGDVLSAVSPNYMKCDSSCHIIGKTGLSMSDFGIYTTQKVRDANIHPRCSARFFPPKKSGALGRGVKFVSKNAFPLR